MRLGACDLATQSFFHEGAIAHHLSANCSACKARGGASGHDLTESANRFMCTRARREGGTLRLSVELLEGVAGGEEVGHRINCGIGNRGNYREEL